MKFPVRRVITGHDDKGNAIVAFDEIPGNSVSRRAGHRSCVIWTTEGMPASNDGNDDAGQAKINRTMTDGTVFRIIELAPGVAPARHRTDSTDYIAVMSGECDMELENGVEVHLKAGDVMVQRGTIHNWVNRGKEPCVMAVVLIAAKPAAAGGKVLHAEN
jgi:quercetin dioxygenase-like cupin family protein